MSVAHFCFEMLWSLGYEAEFAANGAEAVKSLVSGQYSTILMDVVMPAMNGIEATKRIRITRPDHRSHRKRNA